MTQNCKFIIVQLTVVVIPLSPSAMTQLCPFAPLRHQVELTSHNDFTLCLNGTRFCVFFPHFSYAQPNFRRRQGSYRSALKGRLAACCRQPCCSGNARGGPAPPLSRFMPSQRSALSPSPSQSLCSIGQRGVSAASPIVSGESLATAGTVTALLATGTAEPAKQEKLQPTSGQSGALQTEGAGLTQK